MTENEITKAITESMKPVIERMQGILKPELQKPGRRRGAVRAVPH